MKKRIICILALALFFLSNIVFANNEQDSEGLQNNSTKPKYMAFDYEYQEGPYLRQLRGIVKDPQGLWQALLPLQPPPGARGSYGLIGDDSLLRQEPGYGLRQLGKIARQYLTVDVIYVVQPPGFWDLGIQGGAFTSIEALNNPTLGWIFFDLRPKFEADLKKFFELAP